MAMTGWCRSVVLSFKDKQNKIKPPKQAPQIFWGGFKTEKEEKRSRYYKYFALTTFLLKVLTTFPDGGVSLSLNQDVWSRRQG